MLIGRKLHYFHFELESVKVKRMPFQGHQHIFSFNDTLQTTVSF